MIESAEEFKRWWDAPQSLERVKKLREPAAPEVWREIVDQHPECRADIAWRRDLPLDLLADLRSDDDEHVRWRVRSNGTWLAAHPEDAEPWRDDPDVPVTFRLSHDERELLRRGLGEWGGPADCTEELAQAMGFQGVADLFEEGRRIGAAIASGQAVSRTDWTRALLATEIVFVSDVVGSGGDWEITTGYTDSATLALLRGLQRKIVWGGVVGGVFGTRPPRSAPSFDQGEPPNQ